MKAKLAPPRLPQPPHERSRAALILLRWAAILELSVGTAGLGILALWMTRERLPRLDAEVPRWIPAILVIVLVILWLSRSRNRAASLGLLHSATYPPFWLGASVGLASALAIGRSGALFDLRLANGALGWINDTIFTLFGIPLLIVSTSLMRAGLRRSIIRARVYRRAHPRQSIEKDPGGWAGISEAIRIRTQRELVAWIRNDWPLTPLDPDLFGYSEIAARMAARLSGTEPSAQALIGPLGAGKSSIRNLVRGELEKQNQLRANKITLVPVELWPFETTRGAVQGVIRALVAALAHEVSVLKLNGIPETYVQAISALNPRLSFVSRFAAPPESPIEMLRIFDDIAACIGQRFVLWVEDLERFAPADRDDPARDMGEAEKLAPIRALLHAFDERTNISVVTSTTNLFTRFDLEKIARHVERLPRLDRDQVRNIFRALHDYWTERGGYLDAATASERQSVGWRQDPQARELRRFGLGEEISTVADAVIELARTPRTLKQILRACDDRWAVLCGEIDLDDLIAATAIREAVPSAFALLEDRFDGLRTPPRSEQTKPRQSGGSTMAEFVARIDQATDDPLYRVAIEVIVRAFFKNPRIQGLGRVAHVDYWQRFLTVPRIEAGGSDQAVISLLTGPEFKPIGYPDRLTPVNPDQIAEALLSMRLAPAVEHFGSLIQADLLCDVLGSLVRKLASQDPEYWPDDGPRGIVHLWRILLQRRRRSALPDGLIDALRKALALSVADNLTLFFELERWFFTNSDSAELELFSSSERERLAREARELLAYEFAGRARHLVNALRGSQDPILLWLVYGLERIRNNDLRAIPFPDWDVFRDVLLEAMFEYPERMLPLVAVLITTQQGGERRELYGFDPAKTRLLFGDQDLVLLLYQIPIARKATVQYQAVASAAQELQAADSARQAFLTSLNQRLAASSGVPPGLLTTDAVRPGSDETSN